ncbi:MAG: M20/M25/M40 family metallo-hydrolase [Acidobacteria bacterium]|nr:M20/M25/M40 family metallo-hydrolase [Acidobacteriota bacterium]
MDTFQLTRQLIDIPSVTGNEKEVALFLKDVLMEMGAQIYLEEAEPDRPNVWAHWGKPEVVLSTHLDTVPPFFASREDEGYIYGRGACDAKGIIAAQVGAAAQLLAQGTGDFGLLFVVGEERNSAGANAANKNSPDSQYLIDGEPTENRLAVGTKGVLRLEMEAKGRTAHSAYPELGESAIEKLVEALYLLRGIELPEDETLGKTTYNIGTIQGGVAPNVIPDSARAEVMFRLVRPAEELFQQIQLAVGHFVEVHKVLEIPPVKLGTIDGLETTVVAFATDIPALSAWGQPFLIGPGSVQVAHTENERISKAELLRAVEIYATMVAKLKQNEGIHPVPVSGETLGEKQNEKSKQEEQREQ